LVAKTTPTAATAMLPIDPQQHAGEEAGEGTEGDFHVGVGAAGEGHAAPRLGKAEDDESHRHGADEVGEGGGRPQDGRDVGGQAEDAAADRDVDDARGQTPDADRADERGLGAGGGSAGGRSADAQAMARAWRPS
jgi:hypothetical protein